MGARSAALAPAPRQLLRPRQLLHLLLLAVLAPATVRAARCKHAGQRFVQDFVQFQCVPGQQEGGQLQPRPIGCVPSNTGDGSAIPPGLTYTGKHFRYECVQDAQEKVQLKVTHCVDNKGAIVAIGEFFSVTNDSGDNESMECVGDERQVKKVVFKWRKCQLQNGAKLTEGNFITQKVPEQSLRTALQAEEIISCQRSGEQVQLECTGCVASSGVHLGVSAYTQVQGQWVQCRRTIDGCRLVNVTDDYINCKHEGRTYKNEETFRSQSGRSEFICDHGSVIKLGRRAEVGPPAFFPGCRMGGVLVSVGDVHYEEDEPLLCRQVDTAMGFGGLKGCELPGAPPKRFMESWRDGAVFKRCAWTGDSAQSVRPAVVEFACWHNKEELPLNRVVRAADGTLSKCADVGAGRLQVRELDKQEQEDYLKKKHFRLNLVEYIGVGGRGVLQDELHDDQSCQDLLPFCKRLATYCADDEPNGLLIDAYEEHEKMNRLFEQLAQVQRGPRRPIGCEAQLAPFRKFQVLVDLACQRTCGRCVSEEQQSSLLDNLEQTAHCGR